MENPTQSLVTLIERARDPSAAMMERHHAFEAIVRRFEHLVVAYTYARLGDPSLAEDAAQDAFLLAWQRLDQLREPAAFPGWIRRLALTQCHRRLRVRRLELRLEDDARDITAPTDPAADAEAAANASLVRLALAQLAPNDRLVLILFYGCERSQAEIADWLRVPVSTVSRRLAHAKRRMRQHVLQGLSGALRAQRRDATDAFVLQLSALIRAAEPDDAAGIASLTGPLLPGQAVRLAPPAPSSAYLVEAPETGTPIAYAAARQTIFRPIYDLQLAVGEGALKRHAGDVVLTQIVRDVAALDAIVLRHRTSGRNGALVEFLCRRGFQIIERTEDWRLDLRAAALASREPSAGWTFTDIAMLSREPQLFDSVMNLLTEAAGEDSRERLFLPINADALRRCLRVQRHGVLAFADGLLHGLIGASPDDVMADALQLNVVVVGRAKRRQGLAGAMLAWLLAVHEGASARMVAHAGSSLSAWLGGRGFTKTADLLLLERLVRTPVAVSPALLDEYVGRYVVEGHPDAAIVIERHGDALISKARDMRDVLLASSESEFFTSHHDGRGRFERDETGQVARLVVNEGARELVAIRA